jgi:hypothetical protein
VSADDDDVVLGSDDDDDEFFDPSVVVDLKTAFDDPATAKIAHKKEAAETTASVLDKLKVEYTAEDTIKFKAITAGVYNGFTQTLGVQSSRAVSTPRTFIKDLGSSGKIPAVAISACVLNSTCADVSTAETKSAGCVGAKSTMGLGGDGDTSLCVYTCADALAGCNAPDDETTVRQRQRRAGGSTTTTISFTMVGSGLDLNAIKAALAAAVSTNNETDDAYTFAFEVTTVLGGKIAASGFAVPVEIELDLSELALYDQNSTDSLTSFLSSAIAVGLVPTFREVMALAVAAYLDDDGESGTATKSSGMHSSAVAVAVVVPLLVVLLAVVLLVLLKKEKAKTGGNKVGMLEGSAGKRDSFA